VVPLLGYEHIKISDGCVASLEHFSIVSDDDIDNSGISGSLFISSTFASNENLEVSSFLAVKASSDRTSVSSQFPFPKASHPIPSL